jgi:hypothetical protein
MIQAALRKHATHELEMHRNRPYSIGFRRTAQSDSLQEDHPHAPITFVAAKDLAAKI